MDGEQRGDRASRPVERQDKRKVDPVRREDAPVPFAHKTTGVHALGPRGFARCSDAVSAYQEEGDDADPSVGHALEEDLTHGSSLLTGGVLRDAIGAMKDNNQQACHPTQRVK